VCFSVFGVSFGLHRSLGCEAERGEAREAQHKGLLVAYSHYFWCLGVSFSKYGARAQAKAKQFAQNRKRHYCGGEKAAKKFAVLYYIQS